MKTHSRLTALAMFLTIIGGLIAPTASASIAANINPWWCSSPIPGFFPTTTALVSTNLAPNSHFYGDCWVQVRSNNVPGWGIFQQGLMLQFGANQDEFLIDDPAFNRGFLEDKESSVLGSLLRAQDEEGFAWSIPAFSVFLTELYFDFDKDFDLFGGDFFLNETGTDTALWGELSSIDIAHLTTSYPATGTYLQFEYDTILYPGGGHVVSMGYTVTEAVPSPAPLVLIFLGIAALAYFARQRRV